MKNKALRHGFSLLVLGLLTLPIISFAQKSASHVRVVRLSYISGTVGVKRPKSTEWAKAIVNTPIQEGFEISTAANSYAEVEFENGSTARIGEFSKLGFDQLALDADGNKLNQLSFQQGYATFHFQPEHHDSYSVKVAESTLTPNGKAEFRADLLHAKARVEVFSGSVQLATASRTVKLGKDKVLEFDPAGTVLASNATTGIVKDSWDKWTANRDTQSQLALMDQAVPARGQMYGWSDLDAYGEWGNFPGFGYGWAPYAGAGWSPYSMGMWSWYQGMGYTWISGEPWGWLPYHSGIWNYAAGFGWFWMPGFGAQFDPALVTWYSGPGWIGWAPLGATLAASQPFITTVPRTTIQNGLLIDSQNSNHVEASAGTVMTHLPFEPGEGAMLSGEHLSVAAELFTPHTESTHAMAPASILMGGDAATEGSLQGRHSLDQPLRARLGTTLGGEYKVGGKVGEFHGDAFGVSHGMNGPQGPDFSRSAASGGPTILPHGEQRMSNAPPVGGNEASQGLAGGMGNTGGPAPSVGAATVGRGGESTSGAKH
jgi:hypothetical protein